MPVKRYTVNEIALAWALYKKRVVYKALVGGQWRTFPTMDAARAAGPHKIETKFARDAMEFPVFLAGLER